MDESRVVLAEYLRIGTRPTAWRDEDESGCRVHRERIKCVRLQSKRKRTGGYGHEKIGKTRSLDRAEER